MSEISGHTDGTRRAEMRALYDEILALRRDALVAEMAGAGQVQAVNPRHRSSAINLLHYLAMRGRDMRELQARLALHGLSSLGRMEAGVLPSLDAVLCTIAAAIGIQPASDIVCTREAGAVQDIDGEPPVSGAAVLDDNAARLLGVPPRRRATRIMVTLPSEAAHDAALVARMGDAGMDIARINCAHDTVDAWARMARHVHMSAGGRVRIAMDLGGPKLRTGPLAPGPQVLRIRPVRDVVGQVLAPGRAWIGVARSGDVHGLKTVPVTDRGWISQRIVGERLVMTDARGSRRVLVVERTLEDAVLVSVAKTVYFVPGLDICADDGTRTRVGQLPRAERFLRIFVGDTVTVTRSLDPAEETGELHHHRIGCTMPEAFDAVHTGHGIWFDDGLIGGIVMAHTHDDITVLITTANPNGSKLRAEKGINLPDTELAVSALTPDDEANVRGCIGVADVFELSFVRSAADVRKLLDLLRDLGAERVGVVVKVETVAGFDALPAVLFELMRWPTIGVMIARGDLAIEAGFERLAEVQEEILWLCEAARVPVIWATQVLDSLASTGVPSRAEVTDAAMGERAECVMLNKGPFIVEAISALADILNRMAGHTDKKRSLMRRLRAWEPS